METATGVIVTKMTYSESLVDRFVVIPDRESTKINKILKDNNIEYQVYSTPTGYNGYYLHTEYKFASKTLAESVVQLLKDNGINTRLSK